MKKIFLQLLGILLLTSCSTKQNVLRSNSDKILGLWSEHWEPDTLEPENSINYVDTLYVFKKKNKLFIECTSDTVYRFSEITFSNDILKFTKENIIDPEERFYIYYTMKYSEKDKEFKGSIVNSRDQHNSITFKKQ